VEDKTSKNLPDARVLQQIHTLLCVHILGQIESEHVISLEREEKENKLLYQPLGDIRNTLDWLEKLFKIKRRGEKEETKEVDKMNQEKNML
jgi:hypothetical protein